MKYVFDSPNWVANLLFGGLALLSTQIIPIVGQILWTGYQFEVMEALHRRSAVPDFTFDRFTEYLLRGLWVFLAYMLLAVVMVPIILVFGGGAFGCVAAVAAAAGGEETAGIAIVVLMLVLIPVFLVVGLAMMVVATPFVLRAGLAQEFNEIFNFGFAKDFLGKTWKDTAVVSLFVIFVTMGLEIVGLLAFCIGVFPAVAYAMLVHAYLLNQLYSIYLARGGEKIPLKA